MDVEQFKKCFGWLESLGVSASKLGRESGVTSQTIFNILNDTHSPNSETLKKLKLGMIELASAYLIMFKSIFDLTGVDFYEFVADLQHVKIANETEH